MIQIIIYLTSKKIIINYNPEKQKMQDLVQMQNDIKKYIYQNKKMKIPRKNIDVEMRVIGGLSNTNYIGIIKNMSTNEKILQVIYRKFGALSDCVNHVLEASLIDYLAKKGIGPKLFYEDPSGSYRIIEFIEGAYNIERPKGLENSIMSKIYPILNSYCLFSYTYKYNIRDEKISLTPLRNDGIEIRRNDITKNQYETCMTEYLDKAKNVFSKFYTQFKNKINPQTNPKDYEDMEFIQYYLDNFKELFTEMHPNFGFMVLNHNDIHRLNFLLRKKDQKLFLIDHEYAYLNLPGNDITNYLNETYFNYEPTYYCTLDKVDFDKTFPYYTKFITDFISTHKFIEKEEYGEEFIKKIKSKKYFISLHNIINLFWFIWSICYVDFDKWEKDHYGEYYIVHGIDRIKLYLIGKKAMEKIKE